MNIILLFFLIPFLQKKLKEACKIHDQDLNVWFVHGFSRSGLDNLFWFRRYFSFPCKATDIKNLPHLKDWGARLKQQFQGTPDLIIAHSMGGRALELIHEEYPKTLVIAVGTPWRVSWAIRTLRKIWRSAYILKDLDHYEPKVLTVGGNHHTSSFAFKVLGFLHFFSLKNNDGIVYNYLNRWQINLNHVQMMGYSFDLLKYDPRICYWLDLIFDNYRNKGKEGLIQFLDTNYKAS